MLPRLDNVSYSDNSHLEGGLHNRPLAKQEWPKFGLLEETLESDSFALSLQGPIITKLPTNKPQNHRLSPPLPPLRLLLRLRACPRRSGTLAPRLLPRLPLLLLEPLLPLLLEPLLPLGLALPLPLSLSS